MTLKVIKLVGHGTTLLNGGGHDVFYTTLEWQNVIKMKVKIKIL